VVRTAAVNGTMTSRWPKDKLITNDKIQAGDVIVGLASFGQANYETEYNSGLGSNGLTSARHDVLNKFYANTYKESFDNNLADDVVYIGTNKLTDEVLRNDGEKTTIGKLLLSPTRTYAPVLKALLQNHFDKIHGLIHCSGGGQTKCLKYLPGNFKIVKDNLLDAPEIFNIIEKSSGSSLREMYEVFNMGCRLEIYCLAADAQTMIETANGFGIAAQIIGRVEAGDKKELVIKIKNAEINY
jgi:phosphoribosylformylglycinamidine cyclo-ligase